MSAQGVWKLQEDLRAMGPKVEAARRELAREDRERETLDRIVELCQLGTLGGVDGGEAKPAILLGRIMECVSRYRAPINAIAVYEEKVRKLEAAAADAGPSPGTEKL